MTREPRQSAQTTAQASIRTRRLNPDEPIRRQTTAQASIRTRRLDPDEPIRRADAERKRDHGRVRGHRALRAHVATALVDRRRERNRPAPRTDTRRHRRAIAPHDLVLDQNPIKSGLCACQTSPTGTEGTRAAVHARDERPVYGTGRWRRAPSRATAAGDGVRTWSAVCRVTREPIYISGNY